MYYQRSLIYRILDSFFRHRIIFLVSTLTVIALLVGYQAMKPKTYVAAYTVIQDNRVIENPLADSQQTSWDDIDSSVYHLQSYISTDDFMKQALTNPDGSALSLNDPIDPSDTGQLERIGKAITVADSAADAFTVSMEYKDPADETKILKGVISTYINDTAQEKSAYFSNDVAFIQMQVDAYREKLTAAEAALTSFKEQNANNLPSEQDAIEQQMVTYQSQAQDLQTQEAEDQQRAQYLRSQIATVPQTIISAQTATDSPLLSQLKSLEVQRDTDLAVKQMKPNHPEVLGLNDQINKLKALMMQKAKSGDAEYKGLTTTDTEPNPLYQALQGQLEQVQIDASGNQAKEAETMQLLAKATIGAARVPTAERTLTNLERDYTTYSSAYDSLMTRLQEAQINEQLNLRQAQNAYVVLPTQSAVSSQGTSKVITMFVGGVIMALLIGVSLVMLCEWLDRSLRDPVDAQRVLNLPILAVLPEADMLRIGEHGDHYLPGPKSDSSQEASKALTG